MEKQKLHLLLADDDMDDCDFFKEATDEIPHILKLTILNDGVSLMDFLLKEHTHLPNLIFLDLNMPKKSGIECLKDIKANHALKHIPIIIYSTSLDKTVALHLYHMGALHYIQKPVEFTNIKKVIKKAIGLLSNINSEQSSKEHFIIQS
ncbi:response regulator [Mariniflexile ostreae]|uniref:Response regulator n=1 Tax=Mariniflexile ostreae TaxID=1520892 RepID=A0ABV5FA32_9FLAO